MKMTVAVWENIQNECFTDEDNSSTFRDDAHRALYHLIDARTHGKRYSDQVGISLTRLAAYGDLEPIVNEAVKRIEARKEKVS